MQTLTLPKMSAQRARLINALLSRALPQAVSIASQIESQIESQAEIKADKAQCQLDLAKDLLTLTNQPPFVPQITLFCDLAGAIWKIELDSLEILTLMPTLAKWQAKANNNFANLPSELILASVEYLFAPLLNNLGKWFATKISFIAEPKNLANITWQEAIPLILHLPIEENQRASNTINLRLFWADSASAHFVIERLESLPLHKHNNILDHSSNNALTTDLATTLKGEIYTCPLQIGSLTLAPHLVRDLASGDILIPDVWQAEQPYLILPNARPILCKLADHKLEILGEAFDLATKQHEGKMPEETKTQNDASIENPEPKANTENKALLESKDLNSIELPLSFTLGTLNLSLEEIASLKQGAIFTLNADMANLPILIYLTDKLIAKGRLVDISGTCGIQIVSLDNLDELKQAEALKLTLGKEQDAEQTANKPEAVDANQQNMRLTV